MNKININLRVPSIEKDYSVFIPVGLKVCNVIYFLNKSINEMTNNNFPIRNDLTLIDTSAKKLINPELTIKEAQVLNNSNIILL